MRRHVIVLLGIVLLLATSVMTISCLPSSKSNSSQDAPTDSIAYKSSVDAVQKNLDSQTKRIDDLYGKIGSAAAPPDLSGYEKKSDLTTDVNKIVEQYLKDHPQKSTPVEDGEEENADNLVATNKDLELYLTKLNPDTDTLIFSISQSVRFDFEVVNKSGGSSHRFEAVIYLYPSDEEKAWADNLDIYSDVSMKVTGTPGAKPGSASTDPIIIKCTDGWVGKGDITEFTLTGVVSVDGSGEFEYDYSVRQTD